MKINRGPTHEARHVQAGTIAKTRAGVPAPGGRLLATGGGCSRPQFAIALHSDGARLVHLGGFGAKREYRPNVGRRPIANDMTDGKLSPHVILIVEDDPFLKMLTIGLIEDAGFVALQADNADEAVAILAARSDIALLITDINMPGSMDGVKLAHAVRDRWPPVKIIVVSSRAPESDLPAGSRFFAKPYPADTMISEIRSLIGA